MSLLDFVGLAAVRSPHLGKSLIGYTMAVGMLAAQAVRILVSGGARGIDQAVMRGALNTGGKTCGVLADSLAKTPMSRENRDLL